MHLHLHPDYDRHVVATPIRCMRFGGVDVWLKDETTQVSGSFKFRGALNFSLHSARGSRFVTASTGNHAAGMAFASRITGSHVTTVVPASTPARKIERVQEAGGDVIRHGADYEESRAFALDLARYLGATYAPSFDDPRIVSGHSRIFSEAKAAGADTVDITFVPVGGGGLLASALLSAPGKVLGVELDISPGMSQSLAAGAVIPVRTARNDFIDGMGAEGLIVQNVGNLPFQIARTYRPEIVLVSQRELLDAMGWCWEFPALRVEMSAAASVAAMLRMLRDSPGSERPKSVLCVVTGGNIDEDVWKLAVGETTHRST